MPPSQSTNETRGHRSNGAGLRVAHAGSTGTVRARGAEAARNRRRTVNGVPIWAMAHSRRRAPRRLVVKNDGRRIGRGRPRSEPPSPESRIARYPMTRRHGPRVQAAVAFPGRPPGTTCALPSCGLDVWVFTSTKVRRQCPTALQTAWQAWITRGWPPCWCTGAPPGPKMTPKRPRSPGSDKLPVGPNRTTRDGPIGGCVGCLGFWVRWSRVSPLLHARGLVAAWTSKLPTLSVMRPGTWQRR